MNLTTVPLETAAAWKEVEAGKYPANRAWYIKKILEKWYCLLPIAILIALWNWWYWQNSIETSVINGILATGFFCLIFPDWFAKSQAVWGAEDSLVNASPAGVATVEYTKLEYSLETLRRGSLPPLASVLWAIATQKDGSVRREAVALWRNKPANA